MSKTTQRRAAAFDKGHADALARRPNKWTKDRSLRNTYKEGYQIGLMDRERNHRLRLGIPDRPREDWGPDPVQHEAPRPYRGF